MSNLQKTYNKWIWFGIAILIILIAAVGESKHNYKSIPIVDSSGWSEPDTNILNHSELNPWDDSSHDEGEIGVGVVNSTDHLPLINMMSVDNSTWNGSGIVTHIYANNVTVAKGLKNSGGIISISGLPYHVEVTNNIWHHGLYIPTDKFPILPKYIDSIDWIILINTHDEFQSVSFVNGVCIDTLRWDDHHWHVVIANDTTMKTGPRSEWSQVDRDNEDLMMSWWSKPVHWYFLKRIGTNTILVNPHP